MRETEKSTKERLAHAQLQMASVHQKETAKFKDHDKKQTRLQEKRLKRKLATDRDSVNEKMER